MGERERSGLSGAPGQAGTLVTGSVALAMALLAVTVGINVGAEAIGESADDVTIAVSTQPSDATAAAATDETKDTQAGQEPAATDRPPPPTTAPPATAPPTTAPPTTAPPTTAAPAPRFTLDPYRGLGTWVDVYDWSITFARGIPPLEPDVIDRMAAVGVRTLYLQAAKWDGPVGVLEPERLQVLIDRAHANDMDVVVWYLPTLVDPAADLARLVAIAELDVEGVGVDIESREVPDPVERNRRLVQLSADLRGLLPGEVLSAIVLPPVVMEDVNPNYWPGFPWAELGPHYDVWQPMAYWTFRRSDSGWRDGYSYTAANIDRVRERIGHPDAPVHPIGGIADAHGADDVAAMVQAATERGALGGSLYDFRTIEANAARDAIWTAQAAFNV
jgi:hypothetical protein